METMRKILHNGSCRFEILEKHDSVLHFPDIASAIAFLRRFKDDPLHMASLRACVAADFHDIDRLDAEQILERFAALLVSGKIVMIRSIDLAAGPPPEPPAEGQKSEARDSAKPRSPKPKSWVEINLKDSRGDPVAGERYRIKLPDGSVQEGTLDGFGHAEYYEILRGSCEVSFPDLEDEEWAKA
jgi:hypothetical protein